MCKEKILKNTYLLERRVYGGPRPSDYFHNFGLWEVKSWTYFQNIIMFYIKKEWPHLAQQLSLNKLLIIWSKSRSFSSKTSNMNHWDSPVLGIISMILAFGRLKSGLNVKISSCIIHQKNSLT